MSVTAGLQLMLPALRSVSDALVDDAVRTTTEAGSIVSCTKGCGACCRQLVPVLPIELAPIRSVVQALTPQRRETVLKRAREARDAAERAGLGPAIADGGGPTLGSRHRLAMAWFKLGLDCPFLEDGACSIYSERPLACREYLVTNDPAQCSDPKSDNITRVQLSGSGSEAYKRAATAVGVKNARTVHTLGDAILAAGDPPPAEPA